MSFCELADSSLTIHPAARQIAAMKMNLHAPRMAITRKTNAATRHIAEQIFSICSLLRWVFTREELKWLIVRSDYAVGAAIQTVCQNICSPMRNRTATVRTGI